LTDFGQVGALSRLISAQSAPDEEVVVAPLQAEFDTDMLASYLPVTFDKLLQTVMKFIKSRWLDLRLLRQHADWTPRVPQN
jgi:hypothetical protein